MTSTGHRYLQLPSKYDAPLLGSQSPSRSPTIHPKTRKGRRLAIALAGLIPTVVLLTLLLALSLFGIRFNDTSQDFGCDPNGDVWFLQSPDLWGKNYGLAITLGFGEFAYSTVRAIDICWDLVVGRGLQVLGALMVYYVFRGPTIVEMRRHAVPYEKVLKMEYNTASPSALLTYMRDLHWQRQYFVAFIMSLSTIFVLVLPTWVSAMSGYQPMDVALLKMEMGNYVAFADLQRCAYLIQDGDRIGLGRNACVRPATNASNLYSSVGTYIQEYVTYSYTNGWTGNASPPNATDSPSSISVPGPAGLHSLFLQAPLLNISTTHYESTTYAFYYDSQPITADYLAANGMCAPQKSYRWGFSLILLFMFLSVSWLLSILLYTVWVRHFWIHSGEEDGAEKVFGSLRTTLAVARSIRQELGEEPAEIMNNKELTAQLRMRGKGMTLRQVGHERRHEEAAPYGGLGLSEVQLQQMPRTSRTSSSTYVPSIGHGRARSESSFV